MQNTCLPDTGAAVEIPVLKCRVHLTSHLAVVSYPLFYPGMCLSSETFVLECLNILMFTKGCGEDFLLVVFFNPDQLGNFLVMTDATKHNGNICVKKYTFFFCLAYLFKNKYESEIECI